MLLERIPSGVVTTTVGKLLLVEARAVFSTITTRPWRPSRARGCGREAKLAASRETHSGCHPVCYTAPSHHLRRTTPSPRLQSDASARHAN